MKIWILVTNVTEKDSERYNRADITSMFPDVEVLFLDAMGLDITSGEKLTISYQGKEVEAPDAFWPIFSNTDAFSVEKALMEAGSKCLINFDDYVVARSKSLTYQRLATNGFPVPETMVFFNKVNKNKLIEKFNFPFIIKTDNGYGGQGVELIENEANLDEYISKLSYGVTYNAQEFIASSKGTDLRVIMYNNEYCESYIRKSENENEFKSNVHTGGTPTWVDIDDKTLALCKKISQLFDLPLLGIDLLFGEKENEYVICEVNAFPGIAIKEKLVPVVMDIVKNVMVSDKQ